MAQIPDSYLSPPDSQSFVFIAQNPNESSKKASVYSQARKDTERKKRKRAISALKTSKPLPVKHFLAEEPTSSNSFAGFEAPSADCNSEFWYPRDTAVDWPLSHSLDSNISPLGCRANRAFIPLPHSRSQTTNDMELESSMPPTTDLRSQNTGENYTCCEQQCNDMLPVTPAEDCTYSESNSWERLEGQSLLLEDLSPQLHETSGYDVPLLTWADTTWNESMSHTPHVNNGDSRDFDSSGTGERWFTSGERETYSGSFGP